MSFHITRLHKTIDPASGESDLYYLPTLATIQLRAWLTVPLDALIYYGPPSSHPAIIDWSMQRHRNSLLNDPTCEFLVLLYCENPEVGEPWKVVAFVKYNVYRSKGELEGRMDTGPRSWPEWTNVKLVEQFWGEIAKAREAHSESMGPHVSVDILATDPGYQRRGAGRMLMEAVMAEADELGLPAVLEGVRRGSSCIGLWGLRWWGVFGWIWDGGWMEGIRGGSGGGV